MTKTYAKYNKVNSVVYFDMQTYIHTQVRAQIESSMEEDRERERKRKKKEEWINFLKQVKKMLLQAKSKKNTAPLKNIF